MPNPRAVSFMPLFSAPHGRPDPVATAMSQVGLPTSVCGQTAIVPVVNSVVPPAADLVGGAMALPGWGSVPPRLVKKVLALEFVDMWELPPESWRLESTESGCCNPHRSRWELLTSFPLWVEYYASLVATLTTRYPEKTLHFMAYLRTITRASRNFEGAVPFGLRSALKIFTAVVDALEWCLRQSGVTHIDHYLDDYITMGAPATSECQHNLSLILDRCETLGVPIAPEKLVGPSTCLTFLGIEIDTEEGVMRLPAEKLARIQSQICDWSQRRVCRGWHLESLIGLLQHTCRVVHPVRSFLRQIISLLSHSHCPYHHVRLMKHFRADLCWWQTFLPAWNGVLCCRPNLNSLCALHRMPPASGGVGPGGTQTGSNSGGPNQH